MLILRLFLTPSYLIKIVGFIILTAEVLTPTLIHPGLGWSAGRVDLGICYFLERNEALSLSHYGPLNDGASAPGVSGLGVLSGFE